MSVRFCQIFFSATLSFSYLVIISYRGLSTIGYSGLQLRNVGIFEALSCTPVTNLPTKNESSVYHCPPHVFLGAVSVSSLYSITRFLIIPIALLILTLLKTAKN